MQLFLLVCASWLWGGLEACRNDPTKAAPIEARLELAAGAVRLGTVDPLPTARTGAAIPMEGRLETGAGARAMARLSDGSALVLRAESALSLEGTAVRLDHGELFVDASPAQGRQSVRYLLGDNEISADNASFFLKRAVEGDDCSVVVTRGEVTATAASGRVSVRTGEQASLVSGKATVSPVAYHSDWTGGMADHAAAGALSGAGAGRIYGVGGPTVRPLDIQRQDVRAVVRGGLMETEVDQVFFNPQPQDLEGWYWFRLPDGAMVTTYAVEFAGQMVEGAFVERNRAAAGYAAASSAGLEPSLLEWVDPHTVRARINPIPAMGTRRVVLRYLQRLDQEGGVLHITHPLRSEDPARIGEFSLTVDLGDDGETMTLSTLEDARIEEGGRKVTMRRTDFVPRADFLLEGKLKKKPAALRVSRYGAGGQTADYVMVRYQPDVDWEKVGPQKADVVLLVDTSAGIDEATRQLQAATVEAVLRTLSGEDRFALLSVDVATTLLHPATDELAPATEESTSRALERLSEHGYAGATDLSASFGVALSLLHDSAQPAIVYVGDGNATTGALSGEQLRTHLASALEASRARFYALGVGPSANHALLAELARTGGGKAFSVATADETTDRALWLASEVKTPTLTELVLDLGAGMDSVYDLSGGKVRAGEEILWLGRTHHPLPREVTVKGTLQGEPVTFQETPVVDDALIASFAPKLWAMASIEHKLGSADRPDDLWGEVARTGIEYGLLTPYSSVLVLENDAAFQRLGIPRGPQPLQGVHLVDLAAAEAIAPWAASMGCSRYDEDARSMPSSMGPVSTPALVMAPPSPSPASPLEESPVVEAREGKAKSQGARHLDGLITMREAEVAAVTLDGGDKDGAKQRAKTEQVAVQGCSDRSGRPLVDRISLWRRTLYAGEAPLAIYEEALTRCEIEDWASEAALLDLMSAHLKTPQDARDALSGLAARPASQGRLATSLIRRATDPLLVAAIQSVLASTAGGEQVILSPLRARETGDALAAQGDAAGAVRAYSEMVEFDPYGVASRRSLGDLLLAHGWYDAAYRQYETLVERGEGEALLRQAIAAAGASRTDEALRILRIVSSSPSRRADEPSSPGGTAELWTAALLARLLESVPEGGSIENERMGDDLRRRLKELPFFRAPAELWVLTWEDLSGDAATTELSAQEQGQRYDGSSVGAVGLLLLPDAASAPEAVSRVPVSARLHRIRWDGTHFEVHTEPVNAQPRQGASG